MRIRFCIVEHVSHFNDDDDVEYQVLSDLSCLQYNDTVHLMMIWHSPPADQYSDDDYDAMTLHTGTVFAAT